MKKLITSIMFFGALTAVFAQDNNKVLDSAEETQISKELSLQDDAELKDTSWTKGGTLGLNLSQVYLDNWAAGGDNSVSVTGLVSLFANYKKNKSSWDNTLDLAYGMLWQGENAGIKTDDKFDFSSKYGRQINEKWYYSGLLNFKTQMAPGYDDPSAPDTVRNTISDMFAPAYGILALGVDFKPNPSFSALIAPVAMKATIVTNQTLADAGAFGVEAAVIDDFGNIVTPGENFRTELGGYVKISYVTDIVENVNLSTKLDLFSNYQNNPQNIDVNWETLITMKINKFLSATISTQVLYDDDVDVIREKEEVDADGVLIAPADIGPAVQLKEVLAIGFSYKF